MKIFRVLIIFTLLVASSCAHAEDDEGLRLGVMKFLSRTEGISEKQAEAIGDVFARVLANSKAITVVERDRLDEIIEAHKLAVSLENDDSLVETGQLAGCQYMLIGAVTSFTKTTTTKDIWLFNETSHEVFVTVDIRIIEVMSGKVIISMSENGYATKSGTGFNFYGLNTEGIDLKDINGMEALAIADAVSKLGFRIRGELAGEYVYVIKPGSKEITMSAGQDWGVLPESLYCIYSDGAEVRGLDGVVRGHEFNDIAVVSVKRVYRDFTTVQVIKGGGRSSVVRKGDKVRPIDRDEVNELVKKKVFPSKRAR